MPTGDLHSFAERMRQYGERVERNATVIKRKVALAVDAEVVVQTPVDTGRARSNWQASLNAPAAGTIEAYAPGKGGNTAGPNTQAALDQAKSVIAGAGQESEINITNNLPYIARLNDGWSAQAPAGYVRAGVLAGIRALQAEPGIVSFDIKEAE